MTIKSRLFLTLSTVIVLSTTCMGFYSYQTQIRQLHQKFKDLAKNENRLFAAILTADAEGLSRALSGLSRLEPLLAPLAEKNRDALLAAAFPVFVDLKTAHNITHMYFIEPDGTVLLRVHKPEQSGDKLERATYLQAAATRRTASGLEMGRNFFSLRCVTPVFVHEKLIGYMEVAEEIDHVFEKMKSITGNDVSLFLPADYIKQYDIDLPAVNNDGFAILYPTDRQMTMQLTARLNGAMQTGLRAFTVNTVAVRGKKYVVGVGPIQDAFGKTAGILFSQRDVSLLYDAVWRGVAISLTVFVAILIVGNALLYLSLRKSLALFHSLRRHIQNVTRTWDLGTRLQVSTHDEIGDLAQDLNLMQFEIWNLKQKLEQRAEELTRVNQELEAFSYSLSHDLRQPLTRIYSAAQMLRDNFAASLDETGSFLVDEICKAGEGMEELIEAILVLSRISRSELRREEVDLSELAAEIGIELNLAESDRTVRLAITPGLVARGDAHLLKVALQNLLGNAWKYTRPVPEPRVEFGMVEQKGKQVFFVRDNGVGFDMKDADKLFTPFKRLHDPSEFPGTGIGLATVQRIIQRQGGTIWGRGVKGKGATFFFTLP